jgi:hypothetical protein
VQAVWSATVRFFVRRVCLRTLRRAHATERQFARCLKRELRRLGRAARRVRGRPLVEPEYMI